MRTLVLLLAVAVRLCASQAAWLPHRINLTSATAYANPYLDVDLNATFTARNGTAVRCNRTRRHCTPLSLCHS